MVHAITFWSKAESAIQKFLVIPIAKFLNGDPGQLALKLVVQPFKAAQELSQLPLLVQEPVAHHCLRPNLAILALAVWIV